MRQYLMIVIVVIAVAAMSIGLIYRMQRVKVTVDVAKVEKDLRDHLPEGSSRAAVESYLDQLGIQHSYIAQSVGDPQYSRTVLAMVRGVSRTWLVRGDVQVVFKFDDQDKLIRYSKKVIYTGP
jgi:hypothetical protein